MVRYSRRRSCFFLLQHLNENGGKIGDTVFGGHGIRGVGRYGGFTVVYCNMNQFESGLTLRETPPYYDMVQIHNCIKYSQFIINFLKTKKACN